MGMLLIALSLVSGQCEGIVVKEYGKRGSGGMFFNAIICLFSMIFFVVTDKNGFNFPPELFIWGILSCIAYASGFYYMYVCLRLGSYANTKLITSFSGIISVVYGIVFLKEDAGFLKFLAIALVFLSMVLMNIKREDDKEKRPVSTKWLICALIAGISNGAIAVLKREQQLRFNKACDNEFMIISLFGAFVFLLVLGLIKEREKLSQTIKKGILFGGCAGLLNGISNFLGLLIYLYVPISVSSPATTGGGIVLSFVVSLLLYKEKFTKLQITSAIIGIIALLLFKFA